MSKKSYVAVSDTNHLVKSQYVIVDGIVRKVKKTFVVKDGVYHLAYQSSIPAGQQIFTSSTTWTVPQGVTKVDIFCVGGGGGSGGGEWYDGNYTWNKYPSCGAGGFTSTLSDVVVSSGDTMTIVVGAGGNGRTTNADGYAGGKSRVQYNGTYIITANGGNGGKGHTYSSSSVSNVNGANGGSGSGVGGSDYNSTTTRWIDNGTNGVDGSDGGRGLDNSGSYRGTAGTGQGTTTRFFGESNGTLYSSAGIANENTANTGNGGDFYFIDSTSTRGYIGGYKGDSGIVIIRWAEQEI